MDIDHELHIAIQHTVDHCQLGFTDHVGTDSILRIIIIYIR